MNLDISIEKIDRIGKVTGDKFKKLGIERARDALFYFPFRYTDFSSTTPIAQLKDGQDVNIQGSVELIQNKKGKAKKINITQALISDSSGEIKCIWFNQAFLTRNLKPGDRVSLSGKAKLNLGEITLISPVYEKIYRPGQKLIHTRGLIPNYPSTEKLSQKQIRFLIKKILPLAQDITDYLPGRIKEKLDLPDLSLALQEIHFPTSWKNLEQARYRLAFDELFLLQLKSQIIKKEAKKLKAKKIKFLGPETRSFVSGLGFTPTQAQKRSAWEVLQDLEKETPMARLLEGDVGSGKTLVAALAMLNVALNKGLNQSIIMVPTEILAEQHFHSLTKMFFDWPISIGLLTSTKRKTNSKDSSWGKTKKEQIEHINSGCQIIIGTHSLIQENISFSNLVLAIIDEQHRFGVKQRKALIEKSGDKKTAPHFLSMTATPIPRSLALILFGDLDVSLIDELPSQRKPVITKLVSEEERKKTYEFLKKEIEQKRQIFVICPLIDPSDDLGVKSSKEEYKKLKTFIFPDKKIGILHGKMKSKDKEKVMKNFLEHEYDILVSTSVVEVGVDVPNATIMLIEGADRFGLAQLHQFRGRVGRGADQSYCFLLAENEKEETKERLKALEKYNDGFTLAKIDLKQRGSGDLYGTSQKGFPKLKIATLWDYELMKLAQREAETLISSDPKLEKYPILKAKMKRESEEVHLE